MKKVGLWYQKSHYADILAETINSLDCEYEAQVLPNEPTAAVRMLTTSQFDIVETDELLRYGSVAALLTSLRDTSFVAHIKGWDDYLNSHGQYGLLEQVAIKLLTKYCLRHVDGLMFVTRKTKDMFETEFPLSSTVRYGMPVFDTTVYSDAQPDRDIEDFCVLTVTNLRYEEKLAGVERILKGLRSRFADNHGLTYRIAGGGQYLDELRQLVAEYPYSDSVEVLGYRKDVPQLLAGADLFVYVSFLDSLATTVLEAQAAGLPVIASDTGGIPEAVGGAGIVCSPTVAAVGQSVQNLLDNQSLREELAAYASYRMRDYPRQQAFKHVEFWDCVA